jgi:hypothetical protein
MINGRRFAVPFLLDKVGNVYVLVADGRNIFMLYPNAVRVTFVPTFCAVRFRQSDFVE